MPLIAISLGVKQIPLQKTSGKGAVSAFGEFSKLLCEEGGGVKEAWSLQLPKQKRQLKLTFFYYESFFVVNLSLYILLSLSVMITSYTKSSLVNSLILPLLSILFVIGFILIS